MAALAPAARSVEPEWLDTLSSLDPRASHARRDLQLVNALMGNAGIVARALAQHLGHYADSIAEIGAGEGAFLRAVASHRALARVKPRATLVDRQPCTQRASLAALAARGWEAVAVQADALAWLAASEERDHGAILANLFLHHFESPELEQLLASVASRTRLFVACEPRRSFVGRLGASCLPLLGCNDVTRHDAAVSVRAGFVDGELTALWPRHAGWRILEERRGAFSHLFVARRT
jgi:hypothetical protein